MFAATHWGVSGSESTFEGGKFVSSGSDVFGGLRTGAYGDSRMVDVTEGCARSRNRALEVISATSQKIGFSTSRMSSRKTTAKDTRQLSSPAVPASFCNPAPRASALSQAMLADGSTALNATGATAVLNIGSWTTHAAEVSSHTPGSSVFTYRAAEDWPVRKFRGHENIYYLENKLEFLDTPREWWFDQRLSKIYLSTPGGQADDPSGRVRARVQDYAVVGRNLSHVVFRDVEFFGTGVWLGATKYGDRFSHVEVNSCLFKYGGGSRRVLGEFERHNPPLVLFTGWDLALGSNITVFNSTFHGIEGYPVYKNFDVGQLTLRNNLFEYIDWSCLHAKHPVKFFDDHDSFKYSHWWFDSYSLTAGPGVSASQPSVVERNTLNHHGASEGLQLMKNTVARLNRIGWK